MLGAQLLNSVRLFVTPWTTAHQAPLPMGTVQARILKWFAMPFSRGSTQLRDQTQVSHTVSRFFPIWATILLLNISKLCIYDSEYYLLNCVQLFATPWTVARQANLSMEFSRRENWSGLPFPSPGDPPDPGIEPGSPALQADAPLSEAPGKPDKCIKQVYFSQLAVHSVLYLHEIWLH